MKLDWLPELPPDMDDSKTKPKTLISFQGSNCKRPSKAVEVCLSTLAGETSDLARAMDRRKHFANIQSKCEPVGMTSNGSTTLKLKLTMIGLLA